MMNIIKRALKAGPRKIIYRYYWQAVIQFSLWPRIRNRFKAAHGLEIGGPSDLFKIDGILPIYPIADRVDVCNFCDSTHWEGLLTEGFNFRPEGRDIGYQYVCGGDDLKRISSNSLDFIISCHNLEHFANPLKAIEEWIRVVRPGGTLLLVLPDPKRTFDHRRPLTTLEHLLADRDANRGEDDPTHVEEAIQLTDLTKYPEDIAPDFATFERACRANFENRFLHHHIFDFKLLEEILNYYKLKIIGKAAPEPYHLVILAEKL